MKANQIQPIPQPGAISIGLSCIGCVDEDGDATCPRYLQGSCSASNAAQCMAAALVEHAEAQTEIVLASISLMATRASTPHELRRSLPRVERVLECSVAS